MGLAVSAARMGKRVLLVDLDISSRSLEVFLGTDSSLFHLGDLLLGRCGCEDILVAPYPALPQFFFCPAPPREQESTLTDTYPGGFPQALYEGCKVLARENFDLIILDTGSGYEIPRALAPLADIGLVCCEQSPASIRAASYTAALLSDVPKVRLVICSFDIEAARREQRAGMLEMIDTCGLKCAAVIPFDPKLLFFQEKGMLPKEKCIAMQAYTNLIKRLDGWDVPLFQGIRKHKRRDAL